MIRYGVWYDLVHLLWYEIICFSLHYISKALTGKSSRPIVLAICAVALNYFILQWLSTFSIWFYFSIRHIVAIALVFGTVYFVCKKRLNINVFKLNGNSVKQSGSTISEEKEALKRCLHAVQQQTQETCFANPAGRSYRKEGAKDGIIAAFIS